jgi:hypothetical protein
MHRELAASLWRGRDNSLNGTHVPAVIGRRLGTLPLMDNNCAQVLVTRYFPEDGLQPTLIKETPYGST